MLYLSSFLSFFFFSLTTSSSIEITNSSLDIQLDLSGVNRYYVGAAFKKGLQDLSTYPNDWATTRTVSGYWLHPMGFDAARSGGFAKTLLSRYGVKQYVYEADLMAWTDGSNPTQTNSPWCWGEWLEQIDPTFKQSFMAPWVAGDRIANQLQDVTNRYIDISNRMKSHNYNNIYFFYSPPSPESIWVADALLNGRVDGKPYIEYVITRVGLKGIALDYPAGLYLASAFPTNFPAGSAEKCRQLALQAYQIAQRLNIPLVWVFNGNDGNTRQAMDSIRAHGINPASWAIDNFSDSNRAGTPESNGATLSGQARQLM